MRNKSHTGVYQVSWQEQLRNLDEELASGRLSADEYRQRRDQVLTSAVTQGDSPQPYAQQTPPGTPPQGQPQSPPPQPPQQPVAESTQIIAPVSPSRGFPQQNPPHSGAPQHNSEATQVVRGVDPGAERTQAVQGMQGGWPAVPGDADRTQVVPGGTASPPGGIPMGGHRQQPTWNTPETDASPPWGGNEFPPLASQGPDSWITQGPEVFGTKSSGKGKVIGIVVAVLVLVGLGVGAFLIWGPGSSNNQAGPSDQPAPPATSQAPAPPPDPLPTAKLAGQAEAHPEIKTMADIPQLNYLGPKELEAYDSATSGAGDTKVVVYHLSDGSQVVLMLTEAFAPAAAQDAVDKLKAVQIENGAKTDTESPVGVQTTEIGVKGGQPAQVRGHYVSGNVIVRVDVSNATGLEAAKSSYDAALAAQLSTLPSNG
ncbi:MAG: hypothetical protein QOI21_798 [Actinomycetota bacterium]|nr:hypothetical protein [Actinomycetota bacterium]